MTSQEILNKFSDRLNELLSERNWSLKEFSEKIKIPRTTINNWTLRKKIPRADLVCVLADFFDVTTDYLLGREE